MLGEKTNIQIHEKLMLGFHAKQNKTIARVLSNDLYQYWIIET